MDLHAINGLSDADSGVAAGEELIEFAEAFAYNDTERLAAARAVIADKLGPKAMVDAAAVVAVFGAVVKIADGTGIPLEEAKAALTVDVRGELGINAFRDHAAD